MFVRVILLREIKPGDGNKFESKPCDCKWCIFRMMFNGFAVMAIEINLLNSLTDNN